jgi:acyl carrier protein
MSITELSDVVVDALCTIAPDVDPTTVDRHAPLLEQVELDSMDFLNFVAALYEATGVDVPESDYGELDSIASVVRYLDAHSPAPG